MATFLNIDYQTWWLLATAILLLVYGVLDGFDLGAGAWHLFLKEENQRQMAMKAIAPIWDGNEVFLIIGGGALFAGFPEVYATLFSAMYIPFMLFLLFLITRAVSIEFRNKEEDLGWRKFFDIGYAVSSAILPLLLGVVIANVLEGMPLDKNFEFTGSWLSFLNPYALVVGLMALLFAMLHGAAFMTLKTEDELQQKFAQYLKKSYQIFVILYVVAVAYSLVKLSGTFPRKTALYIMLIVITALVGRIGYTIQKGNFKCTFIASSLAMVLAGVLALVKHFPMMLPSTTDPSHSITIYNGCGSEKNLETMLIIAAIGVPLVVIYVIFVYRTFWGKVKKEDRGY
ncbi:MAG: cytochrome d ubiquinol oxidase subunit II [Paludibacteraceae bacterium]|nr:cytochrome d ubiquinol oxidase subunit II [Paludibacteraceae bacterium]